MTSPSEVYRISKGGLVELGVSPAHYQTWLLSKSDTTDAMRFGTAFHTAVLEPEKYAEQVVVMPEINRRTNEGKKQYADLLAQVEAKRGVLLDKEDKETVDAMKEVVLSNETIKSLISRPNRLFGNGIEYRLEGRDEEYPNIGLKGRPDFIGEDFILDYKTVTAPPTAREFKKVVWKYRYDMQDVIYRELARQNGATIRHFYFALIEKKKPHSLAIYEIDPRDVAATYREYRESMKVLSRCVESGIWHGLPTSIQVCPIRFHSDEPIDEEEDETASE